MMEMPLYRLALFIVVTLLATGLLAQPPVENPDPGGGGGGGGGCNICRRTVLISGQIVESCGTPSAGGWGARNCTVDCYPEGCYCYTYGEACCVS